jgi:N-acetylglucosamine kinase-like BadF-type ATPase
MTENKNLILGVDGGGTKTAVRIAAVSANGEITALGSGMSGPSNVRAIGAEQAKANLDLAVDAAHKAAGTGNAEVDYAVLGLAAGVLPDVQEEIKNWAAARKLAKRLEIVHDGLPLLALGMRHGRAVGLIVGTGSVAVAVAPSGEQVAVGGWGNLISDKGSGYYLGREALAAIADAADGMARSPGFESAVLQQLGVVEPRQIARALTSSGAAQHGIAALAPLVMSAAIDADPVAIRIVDDAADAAARLVKAAIDKLHLDASAPLALAGGVACSGDYFREALLEKLLQYEISPEPVILVPEPVEGALLMARDRLLAKGQSS